MLRKYWYWVFVLLIFACGGGGGGSDEQTGSAPEIGILEFSVDPVDGATNVLVNQKTIWLTSANDDLDQTSNVNFSVDQGGPVSGKVAFSGNRKIGFTVDKDFKALSTCVIIVSGLKGKSGSIMAKPLVLSFTTGKLIDVTPPSVKSISPDNGLIATPGVTISLIFSEPIDPPSVVIKLANKDTGVDIVGITAAGDSDVSFKPSADLTFGNYRITVLSAKDLFGNAMVNPFPSDFIIKPPIVTTFAAADWVSYSKGGATQATFDKSKGGVTVLTVSSPATPSEVSVRGEPIKIDKTKIYHIGLTCDSVPQKNIQIQLKRSSDYHVYSSITTACNGNVSVDMPKPDDDDPAGRLYINFGGSIGVYTIGTVIVVEY